MSTQNVVTVAPVTQTVAQALVHAFAVRGTRRLFGVPGGGSSLDLIEAARAQGLTFVLTRHECSAVFMAAATAELDGSLGVALTTKGPGTANAANGAAHAWLDRCAVAVVTDGFSAATRAYVSHQWFDQRALLAPLTKAHTTLKGPSAVIDMACVMDLALATPPGPVHIELDGPTARAALASDEPIVPQTAVLAQASAQALVDARSLIGQARRPVILVGLEACEPRACDAVRRLVATLGCPALVTYKAKGVIDDESPQVVGIFTGGAVEQPTVHSADLIILVGLDPVELILQPWPYSIPVLDIATGSRPVHYMEPALSIHGDLASNLKALAEGLSPCPGWTDEEIGHRRRTLQASLGYQGQGNGLSPQEVVMTCARVSKRHACWPRVTVDAGAHMFSATAFWPCHLPRDLLISNGLATMGFALPAAIASALHEPNRPVLAFTGDGGLLMCLGELATAVETGAPLVVVVFNDGALSLIDIKQQQRDLPVQGVRWTRPDFAQVMRGLGGDGWSVASLSELEHAVQQALAGARPALIDVQIDPTGYPNQLAAMRG